MVKVGLLGLVVEVLCVLGILDVAQSPRISLSILIRSLGNAPWALTTTEGVLTFESLNIC